MAKIKNANPKFYNGIHFKSTLEVSCYKKLEASGLSFGYETEKCIVMEGFYPDKMEVHAPSRDKYGKYSRILTRQERKILNVTYTPDFVVKHNGITAYFDVKGYPNDSYAIKKKLFLRNLKDRNDDSHLMFFEPHSVSQMEMAINLIKTKNEQD